MLQRVIICVAVTVWVELLLDYCCSYVIVIFYNCRFYSHDSSFVHGGIEKPGEELPPVMGQAVSC